MELTELAEQLTAQQAEVERISNLLTKEHPELTEEEDAAFARAEGEIKRLKKAINVKKTAEEVKKDQTGDNLRSSTLGAGNAPRVQTTSRTATPEVTDEHRTLALGAWFKRNGKTRRKLEENQIEACRLLNFDPDEGELVIRMGHADRFDRMRREGWSGGHGRSHVGAEERALSSVLGSAGAYTIPTTMMNQIEINMLAFGGVLQAASMMRTTSGEEITWPTADDTTNTGRQLGESGAVTSTAQPTFGVVRWNAYKFTSDEILVPTELIEDSGFDLSGILGQMLGERLGRIQNTKFTTGSGAATPKGIVTCATVATLSTGVATTASATAIAWDEVTDLIHSVNPAYRQGSAFMFHDAIYQHLRKLKDGMGRPLWAEGPNSTPPPTLQGYPYFINMDMASSVAASADTMLFGRLSNYKIRQVNEIRMYRLSERHREEDQDAFLAFIRSDGNLLTAGTPVIRKLTQHA